MLKNRQIFVTILVLSICQWSVIASPPEIHDIGITKAPLETTNAPDNTTTMIPPTTPTTPSTTTTPATTSTTTPSTTSSTTSSTTPMPTTSTVVPSTTVKPTPEPCNGHFNGPSFIGGMVLTIGMIAIGFVAHKIYKSKFDRNYHTL